MRIIVHDVVSQNKSFFYVHIQYLSFALEVNKFPNLIESKIKIYRRFQIIILARRYSLLIIESYINVFYSLF